MSAAIGKTVIGIFIGAFYTFVAWRIWGWFAIPLGAPHISYAHAYGLYALAASVLLWGIMIPEKPENVDVIGHAFAKAILSAIILGEAWLAHLAMGLGA